MSVIRYTVRLLLVWLTLTLVGCAVPATLTSDQAGTAAESQANTQSSIPSVSIAAWSVDGDFTETVASFLANAPQQQPTTGSEVAAATVVFQTGHGHPDKLPKNHQAPWEIVPSDTRYLIQAMCQTMAHGPDNCATGNGKIDYGCPGNWDIGILADTPTHRSVYDRWGKHYLLDHPQTRMLCGDSTLFSPTPDNIKMIWDQYATLNVADAILLGLSDQAVSLCLTLGGYTMTLSPLLNDLEFTTAANEYVGGYYHLLYSPPFSGKYQEEPTLYSLADVQQSKSDVQRNRDILLMLRDEEPEAVEGFTNELLAESDQRLFPRCLPSITVDPVEPVRRQFINPQQNEKFLEVGSEEEFFAAGGGRGTLEERLVSIAREQTAELNLFDQVGGFAPDFVYGRHLLLAVIPIEETERPGNIRVTQKNSTVIFRRLINLLQLPNQTDIDTSRIQTAQDLLNQSRLSPLIYVLGPGGRFHVQVNQNSSVINTFLVARPIVQIDAWSETKAPSEAYIDALFRLEGRIIADLGFSLVEAVDERSKRYLDPFVIDAAAEALYPEREFYLESWSWGYYEEPGFNLDQPRMVLVYQFYFVPKAEMPLLTPRTLWIDASLGTECAW